LPTYKFQTEIVLSQSLINYILTTYNANVMNLIQQSGSTIFYMNFNTQVDANAFVNDVRNRLFSVDILTTWPPPEH
jgi:hypothetical protein